MTRAIDRVATALADSLDDGLNWQDYREQAETAIEAMVDDRDISSRAESLACTLLYPEVDCDGRAYLDEDNVSRIATYLVSERERCISIVKAIDPHNEAEAHLIETIVRKMRGDE